MDKKIFIIILTVSLIMSGLSSVLASDKNQDNTENQILSEQEGTYDVPGRPDLKVKVFVHHEKQNGRPSPVYPPVCYLTDPDSTAPVGAVGWRLPQGAWIYTLNTNSVPSSVGSANLVTMAADAFERWSNATGSKIIFNKDSSNINTVRAVLDGKNIITWGRTSGSALAITYTWYNKNTGLAVETDTIMNNKFSWKWSNPLNWISPETTCADANSYDAQNILTHELGHWLGLNDYYTTDFQNATMYGYGSKAEIKKDTLSTGDVSGIELIY